MAENIISPIPCELAGGGEDLVPAGFVGRLQRLLAGLVLQLTEEGDHGNGDLSAKLEGG